MRHRWIIDGNNVMGSRPDRWWNDRPGGQRRLAEEIAVWCRTHDDDVLVVYDGRSVPDVVGVSGGNLTIEYAQSRRRNAADDVIVARATSVDARSATTIVTADRGLKARLPVHISVTGPRSFFQEMSTGDQPRR